MEKTYRSFLIAIIIFTAGWIVFSDKTAEIQIGDVFLRVELAESAAAKEKGLSGRASLGENQGMLFLFQEPGYYGFWMKDMDFPIDILWIAKDKRVVEITHNIAPDTFPETFYSKEPAQYVLEANGGWAKEHGIMPGDSITGL